MDSQFTNSQSQVDNDNYVDSDMVTLNGFSFCARHGLELCGKCPTDNRMINNMQVEDMLNDTLTEEELESKWQGDDRPPFEVTGQWTKVGSGKPGCIMHKTVACEECFNWGDKILSDIRGKKKTARRSRKERKSASRLE
ncbi:hypothetical protein DM01DRAFT_1310920 [Hesseltinella vesiculosa]|uniref:Uncharacterized protein n=1 Tax=Hesseltinella vesiculosa TaxID=101127 RepID=A0A1X2G779_9FUNG|nr:hypothetical protein DM01DRAFT_1310920 [Hesseltinella vesiculosa]